MKNLKEIAKKSYFKPLLKILLHVLIIGAVTIAFQIITVSNSEYETYTSEQIKNYKTIINKKDSLNNILLENEKILMTKIDSIEKNKKVIIVEYDKKIKNIYSAYAIEHAVWMDSILAKVNDLKKQ